MSNEALNAHISFGEPCGNDADLAEIADWAGEKVMELSRRLDAVYESSIELMIPYVSMDLVRDLGCLRRDIDNWQGDYQENNRYRQLVEVLIRETRVRIEEANNEVSG